MWYANVSMQDQAVRGGPACEGWGSVKEPSGWFSPDICVDSKQHMRQWGYVRYVGQHKGHAHTIKHHHVILVSISTAYFKNIFNEVQKLHIYSYFIRYRCIRNETAQPFVVFSPSTQSGWTSLKNNVFAMTSCSVPVGSLHVDAFFFFGRIGR